MNQTWRTIFRVLLTALFGVFSLPMFGLGAYFLVCWYRIHTSDAYYVEFSYFTASLAWIGVGVLSFLVTLYGAWRRNFYGVLFVVPLFLGFATMAIIPDGRPSNFGSMIADVNYRSSIISFLRVWSDVNRRFPVNDSEFKEAMSKGPAAWQHRVPSAPESRYRQRGIALPYELVIITNATGPRIEGVSKRPGVVYYCVSTDLQEYWVTMTVLYTDVATSAEINPADHMPGKYWIIHQLKR